MGREFEAPAPPNDTTRDTSVVQDIRIVQLPTTEQGGKDWLKSIDSMEKSSSTAGDVLPHFELSDDKGPFGKDTNGDGIPDASINDVNGDGTPDAPTNDANGDGITDAPTNDANGDGITDAPTNDANGDGIPDAPTNDANGDGIPDASIKDVNGDGILDAPIKDAEDDGIADAPTSSVTSQLAWLQQEQRNLEGSDWDQHKGDDDAGSQDTSVEVHGVDSSAPIHSYGYLSSTDRVASERKDTAKKHDQSRENLDPDQRSQLDARTLAASVLSHDVAALASFPDSGVLPQGIDRVSIYDLKMRKDNDGQVVLLAPQTDGAKSDGIPLVRNDGKPVSAMELGQYLRPDGTIFMGAEGRAYRSGDTLAMTPQEVTKPESNSTLMERSPVETQKTIKAWLGETPKSLALRYCNDVNVWPLLAEKNNLSTETDARGNPLATLQRGMTLTLPTESEIANFQARASLAASLQLT